jgi:hypothetical protein
VSKPPDDFKDEVQKSHEIARLENLRDHNHTVAQQHTDSTTLANGRIALSHKNPGNSLAARKEMKEKEKAVRFAMKMMELTLRLNEINIRLDEIDRMQQGIDRQLEAIKNGEAVELDANGRLKDKDAEKALQEYEKKYGLNVDRSDSGAVFHALSLYSQELNEENRLLTEERDDIQQELGDLRNQGQDTTVERKNLLHKGIVSRHQQADVQAHKAVDYKAEQSLKVEEVSYNLSLHDEIRDFMVEYAKVKEIDGPEDRMKREQNIVNSLSPEAKEQLEMTKGVDHLFKPDYFESSNEAKQVEPQPKNELSLSSIDL